MLDKQRIMKDVEREALVVLLIWESMRAQTKPGGYMPRHLLPPAFPLFPNHFLPTLHPPPSLACFSALPPSSSFSVDCGDRLSRAGMRDFRGAWD